MIFIGNDIVSIPRIKDIINNYDKKFLNKIFCKEEITYCENKRFPEIHYSGKFAAKEAVLKSIYHYDDTLKFYLGDIFILNNSISKPVVSIKKNLFEEVSIQISISHTQEYAVAFSILYK